MLILLIVLIQEVGGDAPGFHKIILSTSAVSSTKIGSVLIFARAACDDTAVLFFVLFCFVLFCFVLFCFVFVLFLFLFCLFFMICLIDSSLEGALHLPLKLIWSMAHDEGKHKRGTPPPPLPSPPAPLPPDEQSYDLLLNIETRFSFKA